MEHEILFYENEHKYLVDGEEVPSVTTILDFLTTKNYGAVNPAVLQNAARRGSAVHEVVELIDYGADIEYEVTPEIAPYINAYMDFERDYKPVWESIEQIVYEPTLGYIGTVDRAGYINGNAVVVDIKTNASPTRANKISVCSQTIAYAMALEKPFAERYALYLKKDGTYNFFKCADYEKKYKFSGWELFKQCLSLYNEIERLTIK